MQALVYSAPKTLSMETVPRPILADDEVEIAVEYAGICGSDISGFLGHSARRQPPLVLGHEMVGRLEDGRRVVANPLLSCGKCRECLLGRQNLCDSWRLLGMDKTPGCYAEFVGLPKRQIRFIPDMLPVDRAILAEPLANILHLLRLAAPAQFFTLAIVGAGTMGALLALAAKRLGASYVMVVDPNTERLQVLCNLAADASASPATEEGRQLIDAAKKTGFDLVVDASGASEARQLALDLARPGGDVVLLGMASQRSEMDFVTSIRKEHRVLMSFAYTPVDFELAVDLLERGVIHLGPFTQQLPIEQGQSAFETMAFAPGAVLKMILSLNS
jgi:2-desacetyl-2-hydroxyethyl bacteriochlorophyllide A dehydrogenase